LVAKLELVSQVVVHPDPQQVFLSGITGKLVFFTVCVRTVKLLDAHKKKQVDAARVYVPTEMLQFRSLQDDQEYILARAIKEKKELKWILLARDETDGKGVKGYDLGSTTPPVIPEKPTDANYSTRILEGMGYAHTAFYQNVSVYVTDEGWRIMNNTDARKLTSRWVGLAKAGQQQSNGGGPVGAQPALHGGDAKEQVSAAAGRRGLHIPHVMIM